MNQPKKAAVSKDVQERIDLLMEAIEEYQLHFIRKELQGIISPILTNANAKLNQHEKAKTDKLNHRKSSMLESLGQYAMFRNKKKVAPEPVHETNETKLLSPEQQAEFRTARLRLYDIYLLTKNGTIEHMSEAIKAEEFELQNDLNELAEGKRLVKPWNIDLETYKQDLKEKNLLDKLDNDSFFKQEAGKINENAEERVLLGSIKDNRILRILNNALEQYVANTQYTEYYINKTLTETNNIFTGIINSTYQDFCKTPLGKFLFTMLQLERQELKLTASGASAEKIEKTQENNSITLMHLEDSLSPHDSKLAQKLKKLDLSMATKKEILATVLPEDTFRDLFEKINRELRKEENPQNSQKPAVDQGKFYRR